MQAILSAPLALALTTLAMSSMHAETLDELYGPHPHAAKLWLQWYMGKEPQARIGTWSARTDVAPPFGLKPIFDYNVANDLAEIVTQPALLAELRQRFAGYTGDVKNRGGTR